MISRILFLVILGIALTIIGKITNRMYQNAIEQEEKVKNGESESHYIVTIPSTLSWVMWANVILAIIILIINILVWFQTGKMGDGMVPFCLIYMTIFLIMIAFVKFWWIQVNEDEMEIHRFLRPTKRARFSEINRVREDKMHQLVVYRSGHRLVTVNLLSNNRSSFDASCLRYGVDMSAIPSAEETIQSVQKKQHKDS